jgi:outer membrane receptor protein involved in Fe transport
LDAKVNVYYTKWLDKAMTKSGTLDDGSTYNMNMTGVDALHKGVELELKGHVNRWIELTGMFSLGDWKWDSNATGYAYNEAGQAITKAGTVTEVGAEDHASATINLKGIRVGGSAQTTAALGANVKLSKALKLGADWTFEGRNYAYYSLSGSNLTLGKETTVAEPWRVPEGSTIDVNGSYNFEIAGLKAVLSANVKNLLDYRYIAKAYNPSSGTATEENIYCFYNFGRTYSVRLKVNF